MEKVEENDHQINKELITFPVKVLSILIILVAFSVFVIPWQLQYFCLGFQGIILLLVFVLYRPWFFQLCFWFVFTCCQIFVFWPASYILPIIMYFLMEVLIFKNKNEIIGKWFSFGVIKKKTIFLAILTVISSSLALILWVFLAHPDVSDLFRMVPSKNIWVIIGIGIVFSVFNSIWEEITFKGVLWDHFQYLFSSISIVIIFQGFLFGIVHIAGFPRGWIGAGLAAIYGMSLGIIKHWTRGLGVPMIMHFFADATIFGILVALQL